MIGFNCKFQSQATLRQDVDVLCKFYFENVYSKQEIDLQNLDKVFAIVSDLPDLLQDFQMETVSK